MSPEDTDDFIDMYGLFLEAPSVLTKEEYFASVLFDEKLLQSIQNSQDSFDNRIPYEINKEERIISFNFGDLLLQVPISERLKWKQFYLEIRTTDVVAATIPIHAAYKLLFFDIGSAWERKAVKDYWKKLIENSDSEISGDEPWYSVQDSEQTRQELHYLKQIDQQTNEWRDLKLMSFKPQVLDKYKDNELCNVGSEYISFLRHDKTPVSIALFTIINDVLMMFAKEFYKVPPIEKNHWISYQIQSEQSSDR
jgi:hypothetical protein